MTSFITDFKRKSPNTKIRVMGHSLGAHVIHSTIKNLARNAKNSGILEAVYFFGGSIPPISTILSLQGEEETALS